MLILPSCLVRKINFERENEVSLSLSFECQVYINYTYAIINENLCKSSSELRIFILYRFCKTIII